MIRLGIDIGGSITKAIGIDETGHIFSPVSLTSNDTETVIRKAILKIAEDYKISTGDIECLMLTGVGASHIKDTVEDIPCRHISEFESIGRGGLYLSGLDEAMVVSIGTGTALVYAERGGRCEHVGGTAIGGGTLCGLSKLLAGTGSYDEIIQMASAGNVGNVDIKLGDISGYTDGNSMSGDITMSNFGKAGVTTGKEDAEAGVINMILEAVGSMSIFAARASGTENIVLVGAVAEVPQAADKFRQFNTMTDRKFVIPENSKYATAIGAVLS